MSDNEIEFSNKTLLVMLIMMIIAWVITLSIFSVVQQLSMENIMAVSISGSIFISVMMGFTIYKQRFRDERTMNILDKAGRNGFLVFFYILPLVIVYFSLTGVLMDALLVLVGLWVTSVIVFTITAIYYYKR